MDVLSEKDVESTKNDAERKRCGYYVKRKRRNCKMLPAKGNKYCAEHLCFQDEGLPANVYEQEGSRQHQNETITTKKRVCCPLDPKHTVFEDRLQKHLKKCNSRDKEQQDYFEKHINSDLLECEDSEDGKIALNQIPKEEIDDLIRRVEACYSESKLEIEEQINIHQVLKVELENEEYGESTRKHFLQQASMINILERSNIFRKENVSYLEFGAGKGKLSHWLQKAIGNVSGVDFYLIDRQNHRHKFDCFHRGENQGPSFKRLYIDIEHLNLDPPRYLLDKLCLFRVNNEAKVSTLTGKNLVGIGKHLCGGATDLSLRCLVGGANKKQADANESAKKAKVDTANVELILFALCCYHRCSWSCFVGKDFFSANGFSKTDFDRITKLCSWAVCGVRNVAKDDGERTSRTDVDSSFTSQLSPEEKREVGLKCKRLIDLGRIDYLRKHGYCADLIYYAHSNVTLENVVLLAKPNVTDN